MSEHAPGADPGQPFRFIAVGVWNTVFGYMSFCALYYLLSPHVGLLAIQGVCVVVNVSANYVTYKFLVFRTRGNYLREYLRFYAVYAGPIVVGTALLVLAIDVLHMNAYVAQGLITVLMALVSYVGHKRFSFRPDPVVGGPAAGSEGCVRG